MSLRCGNLRYRVLSAGLREAAEFRDNSLVAQSVFCGYMF